MSPRRSGEAFRRRVYVDSSAYVSMLLDEEGSTELRDQTDGSEMLSSVLLILETKRTLIRLARERAITAEHYYVCRDQIAQNMKLFVLRDLTLDLCDSEVVPGVATPRSLDLVHLRTAIWFNERQKLDRFLTLDTGQKAAAREFGLPV